MGFYTDKAIRAAYPDGENMSVEQLVQAVQDARAVYTHAARTPGTTEAPLRKWGEKQGIGPDRMTAALKLLQATGRLYSLPDDLLPTLAIGDQGKPASRSRAKGRR